MNTKIQTIIQNFVAELTEALQEASHEALSAALGVGAGTVSNGRRAKAASAGPGAAAKSGKRTRRTEEDVQAQLALVVGFLKKAKEPSGAEAIGKALGLTTVELSAPVKLGLSNKTLKKTGNLRGTRYSLK